MTGNVARLVSFGAGLVGLAIIGLVWTGQAASPPRQGFPTDWSHHHIIFSQPATPQRAAALASDVRYRQQWYRQNVARVLSLEAGRDEVVWGPEFHPVRQGEVHADWSQTLGSGGSIGAGNFPAKYSFGITTASCANDYVVYSTGLAGATNQASIVGYSNLYSGCGGTVPSVNWAYNTGGGQVLTSPALSEDGTQVAFVQTSGTSGPAALVLLKWAASTTESVGSPKTLTGVSAAAYRACTAPCMTEIFLVASGGIQVDDRTSSVFPDYTNDILWVGGALGWLHQITGVFRGTPGEVTTGGFPVQVNNTTWISDPVYDSVSGNVFVGDADGFLYRVTAASPPVVTASAQIDFGTGLVSGPIVDSTAQKVYAFASSDGSNNCVGAKPCTAVYQFATNFTAGTTGAEAKVGVSTATTTPNPLYEGAFDSLYQASLNATGNMYVCGDTGANPILYRVPIAAGTFGTVGTVTTVAAVGNTPICSPVTDIANPNTAGGATEAIFFGVETNGRPPVCSTAGCGQRILDTPWRATTSYQVGQEVLVKSTAGNTILINVATTGGMSGSTAPTWSATVGATVSDGSVTWLNQGTITLATVGTWTKNKAYVVGNRITDTNENVEIVTAATGNSGGTVPTWMTTAGQTTTDGSVTWTNAGQLPSDALAMAGGSSGVIMDNVVGAGTLAGASQVYASTLGNQATCGTSSNVGCAIQASQAALK